MATKVNFAGRQLNSSNRSYTVSRKWARIEDGKSSALIREKTNYILRMESKILSKSFRYTQYNCPPRIPCSVSRRACTSALHKVIDCGAGGRPQNHHLKWWRMPPHRLNATQFDDFLNSNGEWMKMGAVGRWGPLNLIRHHRHCLCVCLSVQVKSLCSLAEKHFTVG